MGGCLSGSGKSGTNKTSTNIDNPKRKWRHDFKILMLGNGGAGKSSLVLRFVDNVFHPGYISTIGGEFKETMITTSDNNIDKLYIWDTCGQERVRDITQSYHRGTNGACIAFDLSDKESFAGVEMWLQDVLRYCGDDVPVILVGNKTDLPRLVERAEAEEFAKKHNMEYFESSCLNGTGVAEAFQALAKLCACKLDRK